MSAKLLDYLRNKFNVESDFELAERLGASAPTMSRVRNGRSPVGANLILAIHEQFGIPIKDIKGMIAGEK